MCDIFGNREVDKLLNRFWSISGGLFRILMCLCAEVNQFWRNGTGRLQELENALQRLESEIRNDYYHRLSHLLLEDPKSMETLRVIIRGGSRLPILTTDKLYDIGIFRRYSGNSFGVVNVPAFDASVQCFVEQETSLESQVHFPNKSSFPPKVIVIFYFFEF